MSKILTLITLTIFGLTIFLSGCGEEYEDMTSTSIYIPISFAPSAAAITATAQGAYSARITITGPEMNQITHNQNLDIKPDFSSTHNDIIIIDDIPVGDNRTVNVEILRDGEVLFDGSETVNLSGDGGNLVSIELSSVFLRKIVGAWRLTNTKFAGLLVTFNKDGTVIEDYLLLGGGRTRGAYSIWGDIYAAVIDDSKRSGLVSIKGNTMVIIYTSGIMETYTRQ